jgi:RNA polymerase sigma-70 factor (ECF subfamily)
MTALELPWQELHSRLRAFIGRRVRNEADADDLAQRVLLQIVGGLGSLRESERLHAWIYRVARNAIADHYRSSAGRREYASGHTIELESATKPMLSIPAEEDDRAALRELAACLRPMIGQLPAPYQQAITMADLDGLTQAEAARRAGVSVSGMKSRVQRARLQLRAIVEACCRLNLDTHGSITSFESRRPEGCSCGVCQ